MSSLSDAVPGVLHAIADATGGHPRPGQDRLAVAVAQAIEGHSHVVIEADTGIGKTRGAATPFAMAGMQVLIATGTRALQDQAALHDLPIVVAQLADMGYPRRRVAVLKGRANYPCLQACDDALKGDELTLFDDESHVDSATRAVAHWALDAKPGTEWGQAERRVPADVKAALSVQPDECLGRKCDWFEQCHAEVARRRATEADLILVNHSLLCMFVAFGSKVIPVDEHRTIGLLIDEAHMLEGAAEGAFGTHLAFRTADKGREFGHLADLAAACRKLGLGVVDPQLDEDLLGVADELRRRTYDLLGPDTRLKDRTVTQAERDDIYAKPLAALDEVVDRTTQAVARFEDEGYFDGGRGQALQRKRIEAKVTRATDLSWSYREGGPTVVTHIERVGRGARLTATNIDCAPVFRRKLWRTPAGAPRTVVLMSATIPAGYAARVGIDAPTLEIPSPFDLRQRQLTLCCDTLPSPSKDRPGWEAQAPPVAREIAAAALLTGSVLVLCTSWKMVEQYREALAGLSQQVPGCRIFVDSTQQLTSDVVADFAARDRAVLISAQGAWTGIDLPGKIRAVIIPAVPMAVPGDPVNEARKGLYPSSGWPPHPLDRANAAARLRQAGGRLMRGPTDWGLVVYLDSRVLRSTYARDLQSKLPPASMLVDDSYRAVAIEWLATGGPQC